MVCEEHQIGANCIVVLSIGKTVPGKKKVISYLGFWLIFLVEISDQQVLEGQQCRDVPRYGQNETLGMKKLVMILHMLLVDGGTEQY